MKTEQDGDVYTDETHPLLFQYIDMVTNESYWFGAASGVAFGFCIPVFLYYYLVYAGVISG
jgi:hypothetical protein